MTNTTTLMWFRQDLRLHDNPALTNAAKAGTVIPVFIIDQQHGGAWSPGAASRVWLHQSLKQLNDSLAGKLLVFQGNPQAIINRLANDHSIDRVVWNRCYEPWRIDRDKHIKAALLANGIGCESFNGTLLWEPWHIHKKDGTPYRVFTPYYRKGCLQAPAPAEPLPVPELHLADPIEETCIDELLLEPEHPWHNDVISHWQPGEYGAAERLTRFLEHGLEHYRHGRDYPAQASVSNLSPHLHFGEISIREVWHRAQISGLSSGQEDNLDCFLSELGWREFSYYLLFHFPSLPTDNFQPKFDAFPWQQNDTNLKAWQRGQTGIPIVDAGMRQLWQTGTMHNRVRMITASFLVKNLLIHWHEGEKWFWDCLFDADLAANSASWQWVAGSGADAAPYFRIFNPVTQSQKFDADGQYIDQWVPELKSLPSKHKHAPWDAPDSVLKQAGIQLGHQYPLPIADLKSSRQAALDAFATLKKSA
ncbi:Deoxyribodipyrimidine photo-lyase [BD1-7 clade bacterium]|uniref:Deoxyribodipyrimidine photo-lyase n=1 Tax=BD1-7 clade bacterium TaxID=2029982 RepID=A0A5S9QZW7_9GAMM|nr:Deoxyribodipyrimidine photo-lyase [BD1-7 clade bacterium]